MMKTCSNCNTEKSETDFYRKNATRLQSYCKSCFNEYCKDRWTQRKLDAIERMGGACNHCGFNGHHSALHFHHVHGKDMEWNKMRLVSLQRMNAELDKCILLCANCHAIEHYNN